MTFGVPIIQHQAVNSRLAEIPPRIQAARQLVCMLRSLKDAGRRALKEASMAKLFASEMAEKHVLGRDPFFWRLRVCFPLSSRVDLPGRVRGTDPARAPSDIQRLVIGRAIAE